MLNDVEATVNRWKLALSDGPGGSIDFEELDDFAGASGISCSHCTCSSCGSCQSGCGNCTY